MKISLFEITCQWDLQKSATRYTWHASPFEPPYLQYCDIFSSSVRLIFYNLDQEVKYRSLCNDYMTKKKSYSGTPAFEFCNISELHLLLATLDYSTN